MSYNEFLKRVLTVFVVGLAFVAAWRLRSIFMLGLLAAIIAVSLNIPVTRLQKWGLKRGVSIAITLGGVFLAIALFMSWILPVLVIQMADLIAELPPAFNQVRDTYTDWHAGQSDAIRNFLPEVNDEQLQRFASDVANFVSPIVAGAGNAVMSVVANLIIIIIISVFLLLDPRDFIRGFLTIVPPGYRSRALEIMIELRLTVTTWMTALTLSISITIFLVWLVLGMILGVPNALAVGVIAGVMTIIPNVGSIVPLVPITIFTLADDPRKLPIVLPAYLAIQFMESNVLTPSIVRRELKIPAASILLFQLIAASLLGFFGILLAVPLLAIIITLVREIYIYDTLKMRGKVVDIVPVDEGHYDAVTRETGDPTPGLVAEVRRTGVMFQVHPDVPPEDSNS